MENSLLEKLKDKKISYAILFLSLGILLKMGAKEFVFFDEGLPRFLSGFFFGGGILLMISVFMKRKKGCNGA